MDTIDNKSGAIVSSDVQPIEAKVEQNGLHLVRRGGDMLDSNIDACDIQGFDSDRMRARTLLTAEEEKKLLRRIDWHIMPLCSLMFMLKNMDADNISNARIMNLETDQNIMTQLNLSSNAYALLPVLYYVSTSARGRDYQVLTVNQDTVYRGRGAFKSFAQEDAAVKMASPNHGHLGCCSLLPLRCDK